MLSKHKIVFPVNHTKFGGKPAGTYLFFLLSEICCNPVSLPTGVVILLKCTVWTSMSFVDLLLGFVVIAIDIGFDMIWRDAANKVFQHIVKSWIVSPLVTGLPFGKSGIGRGNWAYYPFLGGKKHSAPVDHDH